MNTRHSLTLLGLALGILIALLIAPQTRWLVRAQLFPWMLLPNRHEEQRNLIVRSHPNDYQIQLVGRMSDTSQTTLDHDRALVQRFPQSASLRANILRYATIHEVRLQRDEDNLLAGQPASVHQADPNNPPPTAAALATFDADAAAGERLDPDNGYFPFLRAFGLFAAHRDKEGMDALQRASEKHLWREYSDDEVEGQWRINDMIYGGREALSAGAISASVLFPHYQQLRSVARIVTYKAVVDELAGHPEQGLAKRKMLGRCGELLGVRSTILIGNLVGVAINSISRSRPGGAPPIKTSLNLSQDQLPQKRLDLYCAYAVKIGHPEASAEAQADYRAWQQIHEATSKIDGFYLGMGEKTAAHLEAALFAGWAIMPNIISVFTLGLLAAGLSRLPRIRTRKPLPAGTTAGFWGLLLVGLIIGATFVNVNPADFPLCSTLVILVTLLLAGLLAARRPHLRRPIGAAIVTAAATALLLGLFAAVIVRLGQSGASITETLRSALSLSSAYSLKAEAATESQAALLETLALLAFTLTVPLLLAIVLSIRSRVKRVPVSVGLVLGFRAVMPPLVFALMLVYGGLTLWTIQQEARANYGLERSLHGEGQYLAQLTGLAWPQR